MTNSSPRTKSRKYLPFRNTCRQTKPLLALAAVLISLLSACESMPQRQAPTDTETPIASPPQHTQPERSPSQVPDVVDIQDGGPSQALSVNHIPNPIVRAEPRTRAGNASPYTVLGKTYVLMDSPEGYSERGLASWYGTKFHGKRTANGEIYDMYGMTAAHKTLPIPSFVKVTHLDNNKVVIVRVNDRGPFHSDRIIDLSYTAAKKLGIEQTGTGAVQVDYINPETHRAAEHTKPRPTPVAAASFSEPQAPRPKNSAGHAIPTNTFLQVGAFSYVATALKLQVKLQKLTDYPVEILQLDGNSLYKVQIGPLNDNYDLNQLKHKIEVEKLASPYVVYR